MLSSCAFVASNVWWAVKRNGFTHVLGFFAVNSVKWKYDMSVDVEYAFAIVMALLTFFNGCGHHLTHQFGNEIRRCYDEPKKC